MLGVIYFYKNNILMAYHKKKANLVGIEFETWECTRHDKGSNETNWKPLNT